MTVAVNFTKAGMGIEEGTVIRWLKVVGDKVLKGEVLVEIENAKSVQEVEAPASGTLVAILVAEGEDVPVNTDLGLIEEETA